MAHAAMNRIAPPDIDEDARKCRISLDDLDELVRLHEEYLNYGEGIRPHFEEILRDPECVALKHCIDGEIAGLIIYTKGIALSGNHEDLVVRLEALTKGKKVYTGDAVLAKKEYRSLGVADNLYAMAIAEFKRIGVELVLHEYWVYPNGSVPARRMFRQLTEIVYSERIADFYSDFHHYGYHCPICGEVCTCAAEICLIKITGGFQ
jgi:GNAT superfamily N-acetyltransferase